MQRIPYRNPNWWKYAKPPCKPVNWLKVIVWTVLIALALAFSLWALFFIVLLNGIVAMSAGTNRQRRSHRR